MFLTKLELMGFKTFADRTTLEFSPGITAVVGPNGTGKSNIADAVLWALGEQNIRNIRGTRVEDVIFTGSDKRKRLGMAEVSLTFDNSCGTLPLAFSEVTVTRRAYRSGEGEYFINRAQCRLKDIYELFLDTGMGREAYSIISQGEVDAVLSAKPEDRRALFEEAAGVKKYRHRRKEATKKLENTEDNLRRVNDIVHELNTQVEPLAEQAEVAKRYTELNTRLRHIEIGLLINDLRRYTTELDKIRQARQDGAERIAEYDSRIADLDAQKAELVRRLSELEDKIEQARTFHQEIQNAVQQLESRLALIDEREKTYRDTRAAIAADISQLESRAEETSARLERMRLDREACVRRETELRSEAATCVEHLTDLDRRLGEAAKAVEEQKASYVEIAAELAAKRNELENRRTRIPELEKKAEQLRAELGSLDKDRDAAIEQKDEALRLIDDFREDMGQAEERLRELGDAERELAENLKSHRENLATLQKESLKKSSRLRALEEMTEAHEGFYEGVRSVMAAHKAGKLQGHYAVVVDVISVPGGLETAMEVVLGSGIQDIITDTVDEAKRAIQFLKENEAGRATFLPLRGIRPTTGMLNDVGKSSGVIGIATDLVVYDAKYAPAIKVLLGKVIVCRDIDSAIKLARGTAGWGKIVTLDGEVIVPTGAMTGGSRVSKGPNLLARKREMDDLADDLKQIEISIAACQEEIGESEKRIAKLDKERDACDKTVADTRVALAEQERRHEFHQLDIARLEREIEAVLVERDEVAAALEIEQAKEKTLTADMKSAGQGNAELDERVADAQRNLEFLRSEREESNADLMRLNIELAAAKERCDSLDTAIKTGGSDLQQADADIRSKRRQLENGSIQAEADSKERESLLVELEKQREATSAAAEELSALLEQKSELAWSHGQIEQDLKSVSSAKAELSDLVHDADIKEARCEVQANQIAVRLDEEYEITRDQALSWPEDIEVKYGTAAEVGRLRREIKSMGMVNIGAVQEYERVRERWDFLTAQKADLEEARNSLYQAIKEIDDSTRDIFLKTFDDVAAAFDLMFKRLFGGGRAEISLTDLDNLLETGIDIEVQLPGKKLQDLALLSGGEKALSASALLFALLTVKPSPFVVLDEVDAALDEANVERFAEVLVEMSARTQFVVITHNKATMEASNTLYGVTMQEPGVSKLISVKLLRETEELLSDDAAAGEIAISDQAAEALERAGIPAA